MQNLTLFNYFRSSTSYRVRIALELKNLTYNYTPVHLLNSGGEQNQATYRKLNAIGGVPTLKHGEKIVSQSLAIIEYIDEVFPTTSPLFPQDPFMRAKVRQFCENINADIHPLQNLKVMQLLEKKFQFTPEQKNAWLNKWIPEGLVALEKMAESTAGLCVFGDSVTAADLFLVPQIFSAKRFNVDVSDFKILSRISDNCNALDAFKKAHPYRQPDTPDELKI